MEIFATIRISVVNTTVLVLDRQPAALVLMELGPTLQVVKYRKPDATDNDQGANGPVEHQIVAVANHAVRKE